MAKKVKKAPRPKAETPRGFRDYFGAEVVRRGEMLRAITEVYHSYGFDPLESSAVETVEALGKFLPDVDRPNEGVFAWQDEDEAWMALRYDLTAPLARVFAQHRLALPNPYRRYAVGPVWRNEKPGPGRYRQFYQCDADTVGTPTVAADAEICMMLGDALERVGIDRGDYVIRVNNRKVLNGIIESVAEIQKQHALPNGLSESGEQEFASLKAMLVSKTDDVLRTLDKFDKVGDSGVRALLSDGRKDQSGAFIPGLGLPHYVSDGFLAFLNARHDDTAITLKRLREVVRYSQQGLEGVDELEQIAELADAQGYSDRVVIDPSVVRGLGYYTGPVYEAELTFEITDEDGAQRQFGSVAGGGRYDDLVKRFTGEAVPATGISIGVDRLLAALSVGRTEPAEHGPVVILAMDRSEMARYQTMCAELRNAGIRAEVFMGGGNMAKQLKYADKRAAPVAVIEGGNEREAGEVTLKDLALGARLSAQIETNEEWKAQPAQTNVARTDLVAGVRAMLDRAG